MNKLLTLVTQGTRKIQENAVAAIGAIASAAESEFLPYLPLLANPFLTMMSQKEETYLVLRARATEAIGMVAVAVGKKPFEPYLKQFFEVVLQGLSLDFSELSESSFNFFSNLALTLEQDFTPFLSFIMPTILESATSSSGLIPKEDEEGGSGIFEGDDEDDDEEDDEEGGGSSSYSVHDSFLDEKTAATQAIGVLASCTKAAFLPYLEQSLHTLEDLAQYFHEEVRHATVISMSRKLLPVSFPVL
jgi:hypothetical protein